MAHIGSNRQTVNEELVTIKDSGSVNARFQTFRNSLKTNFPTYFSTLRDTSPYRLLMQLNIIKRMKAS